MIAAIQTRALEKRYRTKTALSDCTLEVPTGHVVGLVGPNGAGKTTLLQLAVGLVAPSSGEIEVLGRPPAADPRQLARVGFVAQDTPTLAALTVAEHLTMGARLNPTWDAELGRRRIEELELNPSQRAGELSGGQRAQLALTLAVAKRPELLVLDEPVASLDPLARREFLHVLVTVVRAEGSTALLSSHVITDIEQACDRLLVLGGGRKLLDLSIAEACATHRVVDDDAALAGEEVVGRFPGPAGEALALVVGASGPGRSATLEEVVLGHLAAGRLAARAAGRAVSARSTGAAA